MLGQGLAISSQVRASTAEEGPVKTGSDGRGGRPVSWRELPMTLEGDKHTPRTKLRTRGLPTTVSTLWHLPIYMAMPL